MTVGLQIGFQNQPKSNEMSGRMFDGWWPMALKARGLAKFLAPRAASTCWLRVSPGAWGSGLGEPTSWPCGCDPGIIGSKTFEPPNFVNEKKPPKTTFKCSLYH